MAHLASHHEHPPFPTDIPTAPLVSISLAKLESGNSDEKSAYWDAARNLGFFYLDMTGSQLGEKLIKESEELKIVMDQFMSLPLEEKQKYLVNKTETFFGYRRKEFENVTQEIGESFNLRKDDLVGNTSPLPHPALFDQHWKLFQAYARDCRTVIDLMLSILDKKLGLQPGTLYALHRLDARSGDHVRFNRHTGNGFDPERAKAGEHTDFGTLTVLINWLGGLQIRLPPGIHAVPPKEDPNANGVNASVIEDVGSDPRGEWVWVRPVPGKAIINLGDALVKFTAGILRSNVHRVVPPPPSQKSTVRHSLVYFSRPENEVILKRLQGGLIDKQPKMADEDQPGIRSDEWILRRAGGDLSGVYTHEHGLEKRVYYEPPKPAQSIKA